MITDYKTPPHTDWVIKSNNYICACFCFLIFVLALVTISNWRVKIEWINIVFKYSEPTESNLFHYKTGNLSLHLSIPFVSKLIWHEPIQRFKALCMQYAGGFLVDKHETLTFRVVTLTVRISYSMLKMKCVPCFLLWNGYISHLRHNESTLYGWFYFWMCV